MLGNILKKENEVRYINTFCYCHFDTFPILYFIDQMKDYLRIIFPKYYNKNSMHLE